MALKNTHKAALQGVSYTPIALAVQGLFDDEEDRRYYRWIPLIIKRKKDKRKKDDALLLSAFAI